MGQYQVLKIPRGPLQADMLLSVVCCIIVGIMDSELISSVL